MSIVDRNKEFQNQYIANCDNVFEALNSYSRDALELKENSDGKLSDSECLSCIVTDKLPDNLKHRIKVEVAETEYIKNYIYKALADVDDVKVKRCVIVSLATSRKHHNLTYQYQHGLSDGQKSRVRVLCNMIWYSLYPKGLYNG